MKLRRFLKNINIRLAYLFGARKHKETSKDGKPLPIWYKIALKELGVHEKAGLRNNEERILEYHATTTLAAKQDEVPWCSSFVNWCITKSGISGTNSALARSWLKWGRTVVTPYEGCVVVFSRGTLGGHVGFFVKEDGEDIQVLGGNQSNRVCVAAYPKSRLLGFREP